MKKEFIFSISFLFMFCISSLKGQAIVNETTVSTEFTVCLEESPADIVYDVKIIKENEWCYYMEVTAYSAGATDLKITFHDYCMGAFLVNNFPNHQYVKYTFGYLYYDCPILIEFSSQNSYGSKYAQYYTDGISYDFTDIKSMNNNPIDKQEVYTIMGNLKLVLDGNQNINTTNLESGIYIVKTIYKDGTISSKKIIKNNH